MAKTPRLIDIARDLGRRYGGSSQSLDLQWTREAPDEIGMPSLAERSLLA